ncbi:MATE family efflux transporter [Desulfosediminicola ganghwensis]|uniref:MATE family efflux transporter n=1 Tax=Desulfosediminicola ganghwensis TaxID=2569540 RepID=UPI0010ABC762|nr:MATE family efflux transporter [Desulfosediminicola ganghwensis]
MNRDLTTGPIARNIITLALPIIGAAFLQFAYNFTDMLWVGRLGSEAVAALGTSGFLLHLAWAIISILLVGTTIRVSHAIGQKNEQRAESIAFNALTGTLVATVLLTIIVLLFHKQFIGFFRLNDLVTESLAHDYLQVVSIGLVFHFSSQLFNSISHGRGNSKIPFLITLTGVVLNIILDPILIFGFGLGVKGAALATVIAQVVSASLFWVKCGVPFIGPIHFGKINLREIGAICRIGFPPSTQRILFTLVGIVIARIVANWGSDAIAAQKIGLQLEAMTFMTMGGMTGAIVSFTGQNFGSSAMDRVREGYRIGIGIALIIGGTMTTLFLIFAESMVRWFVDDPDVLIMGASYLKIIGLSQCFMCVEMVTSGVMNGIGKTKIPSLINVIFTTIRVPLALWLSSIDSLGLDGIWYTILISTLLRCAFITLAYHKIKDEYIPLEELLLRRPDH